MYRESSHRCRSSSFRCLGYLAMVKAQWRDARDSHVRCRQSIVVRLLLLVFMVLAGSQECVDEYVLEAGDLFDAQAVQLLRGSDDLVIECVFLQSSGAPSRWYTYTHSQMLEGLLHNLERTRQLHHCDIRFPRGLVPYVCHCCCLCVSLSQLHWSRSEKAPKHPWFMTQEQLVEVYWCKTQLEKEARALRIRLDDMRRLGCHLQAGDLLAVWCLPVLSGSSVEAGGSA